MEIEALSSVFLFKYIVKIIISSTKEGKEIIGDVGKMELSFSPLKKAFSFQEFFFKLGIFLQSLDFN